MTITTSASKNCSRSFLRTSLASLATLLVMSAAHAGTADLSSGPFEISVNKFNNSPFTDIYDFTFGAPPMGVISASAIEVKLGNFVDIAWDSTNAFTVYSGPGGTGSILAQFGNPGVSTGSFFVEDLPVGNNLFSLVLKGAAVGNGASLFQPGLKGHYDLNVIAQPIPEPASLALMLAGLCGMAGAARAKRQSKDRVPELQTA